MARTVNYSTVASDSVDDMRGAWYFVEATADDDTPRKRFRFEITGTITGDDGSEKRVTKTLRLQGTAQPNDGKADGSSGNTPAPWAKGDSAMRKNLMKALRGLYKQWRLLANTDDEV